MPPQSAVVATATAVRPAAWVIEPTTLGGQSGCPVYAYDGKLATVLGVHNYGRGQFNEATKVTNQIINQIMQFLA